MTASRGFGIRAFGLKIRVESDSEEMLGVLNRFLLPSLPRAEDLGEPAEIGIRLSDTPGGFEIYRDGVKVSSAEALKDVPLAAVKALDEAVVAKLRAFSAVHAGAVVLGGKALLIPGLSHAGKSSLVAELLRRGAAHLSDEYAVVDDEGLVHPYPRPLLVRNGSPKQTIVLPKDLGACIAASPAEVGWVLGVDYEQEGSWKISRISQGEAVMLLLRNTPHEMGRSPEVVGRFTRAVASAECYTGTRGDAAEAADRILEFVVCK